MKRLTVLGQGWQIGLYLSQIGIKWTNPGLFKISFLFILARIYQNQKVPKPHKLCILKRPQSAKMNRKLILQSPRFVPFGANLSQLEANADISETSRATPPQYSNRGNASP